jgi:hypothetical protein
MSKSRDHETDDQFLAAPVPPCAKNKAFQLDPRMIPAGGDWRGPWAARRGSDVHNIASCVVASAYRMANRESAIKSDILDRYAEKIVFFLPLFLLLIATAQAVSYHLTVNSSTVTVFYHQGLANEWPSAA